MTAQPQTRTFLPYRRQGDIDYDALDFDPDSPEAPPDSMLQNREIDAVRESLRARITRFHQQADVFLDRESFICYDPDNLNVRISPDVYVAFGVDATAIRSRRLYLPWEVGKPPDWVLEVASESTSRRDILVKPEIYARIGVPEIFFLDPTGGDYHGSAMSGWRLQDGEYHQLELTLEPDGVPKIHSDTLGLSLCWDEDWPRVYDPAANVYLEILEQAQDSRDEERAERIAAQAELIAAEAERNREQSARIVAEANSDALRRIAEAERDARMAEHDARIRAEAEASTEHDARMAERDARIRAETETEAERNARIQAEAETERLREMLRRLHQNE